MSAPHDITTSLTDVAFHKEIATPCAIPSSTMLNFLRTPFCSKPYRGIMEPLDILYKILSLSSPESC